MYYLSELLIVRQSEFQQFWYDFAMKYVALLRGINVGGKTRVEMPRLKAAFEQLGYKNVSTYINSGNVIFESQKAPDESDLEIAIRREFKLDVPVIVRSQENLRELVNDIPAGWTNDKEQKTDVMFLWREIDNKDILTKAAVKPEIEKTLYLPGALVWNIGREHVDKGGGIKLIKTDIYPKMTIRNINTVRKLNQLMES